MDFFEAQDRARRTTWKLILIYAVAVILLIVTVYLVALILFGAPAGPAVSNTVDRYWQPNLFFSVASILILIILAGTLFRIAQLRRGGSAVAEMLGGRKLDPSTNDQHERQLLNVVEEMSIASGLPVPDVYVLDNEEDINAFAAGFGTNDAAVGITRGALHQLDRDELQGVIAHEFSHIFNGDMRLNIRLIGVLNGILLLHLMGLILMRSAAFSGATRRVGGSRGQGGGKATIAILLFGLALIVIGYVGMLFGRIIQSAVSRQREYLADAAAVQYTRNPDGIAGALEKIARSQGKGKIQDAHSMELSHLFFANSFHSALDRLFATHPPIEKRIQAIGTVPLQDRSQRITPQSDPSEQKETSEKQPQGEESEEWTTLILAAAGTLDHGRTQRAEKLLSEIPKTLRRAAHEPFGAESLIYALLHTAGLESFAPLTDSLSEKLGSEMTREVERLGHILQDGERKWYLPLAELSLPVLRNMSPDQYRHFRSALEQITQQEERSGLFELILEKMLLHHLDPHFTERSESEIRHHHFHSLGREISLLLSALAHAGTHPPEKSWRAGLRSAEQHLPEDMALLPVEECTVSALSRALDELAASANPVKRYALAAAIRTVTSDRQLSLEEEELLRALSESLEIPIPLDAFEIAS